MDGVTTPIATVVADLDQFEQQIRRRAARRPRLLVGIAGEPGSGKSTVTDALRARLMPDAAVLDMDGFHLPQARLMELGRRDRMGAPDTFDVDGFVDALERVRANDGDVPVPKFDRRIEESVADAAVIRQRHTIVLVDGNYLLHDADGWARVEPLLDVVFYLDPPQRVRQERLIERHVRFGKTPDAAREWTLGPDERNAELIRAGRWRADHVVTLR